MGCNAAAGHQQHSGHETHRIIDYASSDINHVHTTDLTATDRGMRSPGSRRTTCNNRLAATNAPEQVGMIQPIVVVSKVLHVLLLVALAGGSRGRR